MNIFASALAGVFATLFGLIANIAGTLTLLLVSASVALLQWVTSDNFITLSYTGLDNPFIKIGWELSRGLTNIFLVVAMLVIGLGTALRREEFNFKKTLPALIGIALLINFTPVILGLIVDASNILMNFFLQGNLAGGDIMNNLVANQENNLNALFNLEQFWDPLAKTSAAVVSIVLVIFNIITALVYGLFAFLFIFRYVAIWTLTVLSPFAFVAYILPNTRGIWSQWWKHFIQWSFVGAAAAFFLYLGEHFIKMAADANFLTGGMETPGIADAAPIFNGILPYFMAIVFMFIGYFLATHISAVGANYAIAASKRVNAVSLGLARGLPIVRQAEAGTRKGLERVPLINRLVGGRGAYKAQLDTDRKKAGKILETMSSHDIRGELQRPAMPTRDTGLKHAYGVELLAERGDLELGDERYAKAAVSAWGVPSQRIYNSMPTWDPDYSAANPDAIARRVAKMTPEEFRNNVSPQAFKDTFAKSFEVFRGMELTKAKDLGEKGKRTKKEALKRFVTDNLGDINARIAAADPATAARLEQVKIHILSDPNFA